MNEHGVPWAGERPDGSGLSRRRFLSRGSTIAAMSMAGAGPALLSGCGSGDGSSSGALTFWQFYAPGGDIPAQNKWFKELIAAWNAKGERPITLKYLPTSAYVGGTKLQTAFAANQGPDIFVVSPGDFLRYSNGGVLQDLTPAMSQAARDDFYPDLMASRMVDGKIYALPMGGGPLAMYYSVKAFEDVGLAEGDIPTDWDELLDVADKLKKKDRFGVLFETAPGYYQNFTWYPFMWMGGGQVASAGGGQSQFGSEATVQALRIWQQTIELGLAPRKPLGTGADDVVANLGSGYCAMQNAGMWGVADFRAKKPDFEYGLFKLPVPPGSGDYTTDSGGWAFAANSQGKDPETAAKFCVWALGSMSKGSVDRVARWCTEAQTYLPYRKAAMRRAEELGAFESGPMRTFKDSIFPGTRGEPRFPPEVYKPVSDALQACQMKGADPSREAERGAQRVNAFLQGYSGAPVGQSSISASGSGSR